MSKYSFEFKLRIVNEYLSGKGGYARLKQGYGLKSKGQIMNWVNAYKTFGVEGLRRKRRNTAYTSNFKLNAVKC